MRFPAVLVLAAAFAGCASVTTRVVESDPTVRYAPTTDVQVLFEPPQRPYVQIAALEAEGDFGVSEVKLLEDMRERARQLGADAIVRTDSREWYQPPTAVYDPMYDPFFFPRRHYYPFHPFGPPYGGYRWVGGGYYYTAKAIAIRYQAVSPDAPLPAPAAAPRPPG
jgi:hypothetical protein